MILTKIKKTNKRTRKIKIIHRTPIFVFTYYFSHISYYFWSFLLCSCSIYTWYRLKYTKFRNGGLVGGFAISSDGYFFFSASTDSLCVNWKDCQPGQLLGHMICKQGIMGLSTASMLTFSAILLYWHPIFPQNKSSLHMFFFFVRHSTHFLNETPCNISE